MWVIAETDDLPTKYGKIVVTDELGRYRIPELPAATYRVWARGYGLVDSAKTTTPPGRIVDLHPAVAPNDAVAAAMYPAQNWIAMALVNTRQPFKTFAGTKRRSQKSSIPPHRNRFGDSFTTPRREYRHNTQRVAVQNAKKAPRIAGSLLLLSSVVRP